MKKNIISRVITTFVTAVMILTMPVAAFADSGTMSASMTGARELSRSAMHVTYKSASKRVTADDVVKVAESCVGKSKKQLGLKGEWCANFVGYVGKKAGGSGKIGNNAYVGTLAKQTVNDKGGTIIFVNKAAYNACKKRFNSKRVKYNASYKPKKGDLYIQKGKDLGDQYFAHIGIVRKDSTNVAVVYTIEGNTTCEDNKKHKAYQYVEYKTRNKNKMKNPYGFSAFIVPNYDKAINTTPANNNNSQSSQNTAGAITQTTTPAKATTYSLSNMIYPDRTYCPGIKQNIGGVITAKDGKIERIEIGIVKDDKWVSGHKIDKNMNVASYDIGKSANYDIRFGDLSAGTYYYRCWVWSKGKSTRVFNRKFVIAKGNYVFYSDEYNGHVFNQFGWKKFKTAGCYVTSVAMVYSNRFGRKTTPDEIYAKIFGSNASNAGGECRDMPAIKTAAGRLGMKYAYYSGKNFSTSDIKRYASMYPAGVICSTGRHYFVARYNKQYDWLYYNDPGYTIDPNRAADCDHITNINKVYTGSSGVKAIIVLY